jgi:hypothetical protein
VIRVIGVNIRPFLAQVVSLYSGRRQFQNRSLGAGLRAHTYGASFRSRPTSCSQLSAEFVILLPIYPNHKVFVSSIKNSFVPFNHEAPFVAEERGFLKLLPCAQAHNSTAVLLRRQFAVIRPRHSSKRR